MDVHMFCIFSFYNFCIIFQYWNYNNFNCCIIVLWAFKHCCLFGGQLDKYKSSTVSVCVCVRSRACVRVFVSMGGCGVCVIVTRTFLTKYRFLFCFFVCLFFKSVQYYVSCHVYEWSCYQDTNCFAMQSVWRPSVLDTSDGYIDLVSQKWQQVLNSETQ